MTWKKNKKYPGYYIKTFSIVGKCTEEEKRIYGVDFKKAYNTTFEIRVCKLEDGSTIYQNIYCVSNSYNWVHNIIGNECYFKSLRKAKKFVENKVKEYNKKND